MSGCSSSCTCPNCGKVADEYSDYKPFSYSSISCFYCGLQISPTVTFMTLEELNIERKERGMRSLKRLPKQVNNFW